MFNMSISICFEMLTFSCCFKFIMSLMLLVDLVYRHIVERVLLFTYNKGALTTEVDHLIRANIIYHK